MNAQNLSNVENIYINDTIDFGTGNTSISPGQVQTSLATVGDVEATTSVYGNGPNARIYNFSTIQGPLCQFDSAEISSIKLGPSTIITGDNDFPSLTVRQADDGTVAQINASAFVIGDPNDVFNGAYSYDITSNRATVLNSTLQTKYVAYLDDFPSYICSANSSNKQTVLGANTLTPLDCDTTLINIGGFTVLGSTITVPVGGVYEINTSIQFDTVSGGKNEVYYWLRKNGSNVPDSASIVSIVNNGETVGTITLFDNASANDQYTVAIESSDANMAATSFAASGNIPAIPSIITNIKRIG